MTTKDYELEQFYKTIGDRPQRKGEETNTYFDRLVYWYDRDEVERQAENASRKDRQTTNYEDHRKVIETAITIAKKDTQHDIAMCILTNRFFTNYRSETFGGKGSFNTDYSFIIKKIAALYNPDTNRVKPSTIQAELKKFIEPTLVQLNHLAGEVSVVTVPNNNISLQVWASKFNANVAESTSYIIAGMQLGR